ncbi:MAG TPA: nitrous oxide-stimulated promoter family protein [Steroidobacteraceae bacterium]|nr:nitrous oxide-stimulated promoter family protein [Steroidobacteraceae bacterium]
MENRLDHGRLQREWRTMQAMVLIYCRGHEHGATADAGPCPDCAGFLDYAARRLEKCPYGPAKPTCAKCPIHCYKPQPRELARQIMRYAGPRMMVRHPWLSITHFADKARRVEHPMTARRERRRGEPPRA